MLVLVNDKGKQSLKNEKYFLIGLLLFIENNYD